MVDLAPIPVVAAPRKHLSSHQIALVRELVTHGPAYKAQGGWMLGGSYHRAKTFKPLEALNLAAQTYRFGKHRLEANHNARAVVETLEPTSSHKRVASLDRAGRGDVASP